MKNYNMILIEKYEYLTGEEILPSNQKQIIEQAKFTYSLLGKAFEKQTKTIQDQGKKQINALKDLKPKDEEKKQIEAIEDNKIQQVKFDDKLLIQNFLFDGLSAEKMGKIYNMSKQIDFTNLTYYFKSKDITPINFVGFKTPLHIYENVKMVIYQ